MGLLPLNLAPMSEIPSIVLYVFWAGIRDADEAGEGGKVNQVFNPHHVYSNEKPRLRGRARGSSFERRLILDESVPSGLVRSLGRWVSQAQSQFEPVSVGEALNRPSHRGGRGSLIAPQAGRYKKALLGVSRAFLGESGGGLGAASVIRRVSVKKVQPARA
jgi:hypothetical protein